MVDPPAFTTITLSNHPNSKISVFSMYPTLEKPYKYIYQGAAADNIYHSLLTSQLRKDAKGFVASTINKLMITDHPIIHT